MRSDRDMDKPIKTLGSGQKFGVAQVSIDSNLSDSVRLPLILFRVADIRDQTTNGEAFEVWRFGFVGKASKT